MNKQVVTVTVLGHGIGGIRLWVTKDNGKRSLECSKQIYVYDDSSIEVINTMTIKEIKIRKLQRSIKEDAKSFVPIKNWDQAL